VHPRVLARQFAAALGELRDTWDVQYWPAGALPRPTTFATPPAPHVDSPDANAPRPRATEAAPPGTTPPPPSPAPGSAGSGDGPRTRLGVVDDVRTAAKQWTRAQKLEYLRTKNVGDCQRCGLARTRTKIVFGVGNPEARVMFVGEAPGADEDRKGEPFVGRAGQRLDLWLARVGLQRDDVYIANVLKCRPPGNRDPKPDEVDKCAPFLHAQIRAIAPRVLVALGRHAGMLLTRREDLSLKAMRGARLHFDVDQGEGRITRIPIVVTYHPSYVLRQEGSSSGGANDAGGVAALEETVLADLRRALDFAAASASDLG
jgi:DNA polymerase